MLGALYLLSAFYEMLMPSVTEHFHLPSALNNQIPSYLSYFVSGIAFVLFWEELFPRLKILVLPCAAVLAACLWADIPAVSAFFVPFALSVVVMFVAFFAKPLFSAVKKDFSYGMYLVHYPIAMCCILLGLFEKNFGFALFVVVAISFLCAYLLEVFQNALFSPVWKHCAEATK